MATEDAQEALYGLVPAWSVLPTRLRTAIFLLARRRILQTTDGCDDDCHSASLRRLSSPALRVACPLIFENCGFWLLFLFSVWLRSHVLMHTDIFFRVALV